MNEHEPVPGVFSWTGDGSVGPVSLNCLAACKLQFQFRLKLRYCPRGGGGCHALLGASTCLFNEEQLGHPNVLGNPADFNLLCACYHCQYPVLIRMEP